MNLTKRQREIYEFIRDHLDKQGYSPSLEEIRDYFGLSAVSTVHEHVQHLIELGMVDKGPTRVRSLTPLPEKKAQRNFEIPLLGTVAGLGFRRTLGPLPRSLRFVPIHLELYAGDQPFADFDAVAVQCLNDFLGRSDRRSGKPGEEGLGFLLQFGAASRVLDPAVGKPS